MDEPLWIDEVYDQALARWERARDQQTLVGFAAGSYGLTVLVSGWALWSSPFWLQWTAPSVGGALFAAWVVMAVRTRRRLRVLDAAFRRMCARSHPA